MGLSTLRKHKFDNNFHDTQDTICQAEDGIENTEHFLLLCKNFNEIRTTLIRKVTDVMGVDFENFPNKKKVDILLYGVEHCSKVSNQKILEETISFIRRSKRFDNKVS